MPLSLETSRVTGVVVDVVMGAPVIAFVKVPLIVVTPPFLATVDGFNLTVARVGFG